MIRARFITVKQPWASLIMAGIKSPENRSKPVPSTLPPWWRCPYCERRSRGVIEGRCAGGGFCGPAQADGPFPFRLWIHAGAQPDHEALRTLPRLDPSGKARVFRYGVLLGPVTVTGSHHADKCYTIRSDPYEDHRRERIHCSRFALPGMWHHTLADPEPLPEPIPMAGGLGWRFLPDDIADRIRAQGVAL